MFIKIKKIKSKKVLLSMGLVGLLSLNLVACGNSSEDAVLENSIDNTIDDTTDNTESANVENNSSNTELTENNDKSEEDSLVGYWEYADKLFKDQFKYYFREDLTGVYYVGGEQYSFNYSLENNSGTIYFDTHDGIYMNSLNYRLDGEKLIVKDSAGNDVVYERADSGSTNEGNSSSNNANIIKPSGAKNIDGLSFDKVYITSSPYANIGIGITNLNDTDKSIDLSKIVLKMGDNTIKTKLSGNKTYPAKRYKAYAQQIGVEESLELKEGDKISVYYGEDLICDVTVESW